MELFEVLKQRRSVRKFADRPVEEEKIMQVLEAARLSPSAVNYQPRHFIVITDPDLKERLSQTYSRDWFKKAPVVIVALGDHSLSWKRADGKDHCDIDVAIAVDHMTLAATALGLGTCWVCAFDAELAHKILELPDHLEVVALLPMGYPAEDDFTARPRRELEEMVSWNSAPREESGRAHE